MINYKLIYLNIIKFILAFRNKDFLQEKCQMLGVNKNCPQAYFCTSRTNFCEATTQMAFILQKEGQFVHTEVHCATGRTDCEEETEDAVYIFEFKLDGTGSAEDALKQIQEKHYADKYKASKKKIVLIGSSFDEETKTIQNWIVKSL